MKIERIKGDSAVTGCEAYADTPHGKLRYDLLFYHYANLIEARGIENYIDVGGGNGLLADRLLKAFPQLRVVFFDDDEGMVSRAAELMNDHLGEGRLRTARCSVLDKGAMESILADIEPNTLFGFNHVIEYIDDKPSAFDNLMALLAPDSILGVMYLNNSCEALRRVLFKDSVSGVSEQMEIRKVNMGHFGWAEALDTEWLDEYMESRSATQIAQYGMRCVSDFKSPDFTDEHYDELFKLECRVGDNDDFMGFARYRLKFFSKK